MEKIKEAGRAVARPFAVLGAMLSVLLLGSLAMAGSASATTDPVETAFDDMQAKVGVYGAATVALVVAVVLLFFGIKFLRRGASKA